MQSWYCMYCTDCNDFALTIVSDYPVCLTFVLQPETTVLQLGLGEDLCRTLSLATLKAIGLTCSAHIVFHQGMCLALLSDLQAPANVPRSQLHM